MNSSERPLERTERSEELPDRISHLDELITQTDARLAAISPVMSALLAERHQLFALKYLDPDHPEAGGSSIDPRLPIADQLYPELTYNLEVYTADLSLRKNGAVAYHEEIEKYNPNPEDTPRLQQQRSNYRQAILAAAQHFGFVAPELNEASDPLDRKLKLTDSILEPINTPLEAIVVPAAAGLSNHLRLRDTIRNIESGVVQTERIIMAACDRPTSALEKTNLKKAGFTSGETEFELCQAAIHDIAGGYTSEPSQELFAVSLPSGEYPAQLASGTVLIGNKIVRVDIVSAPYDPQRQLENGKPAERAITEETFVAVGELLSNERSTLLIESHDTWAPAQQVIAEKILGVQNNKQILGTGPFKSDRVFIRQDGTADLDKAEAVIDEMVKYNKELINCRATADVMRTELLTEAPEVIHNLLQPVPDMWQLRQLKPIYRSLPIDVKQERSNEPLVKLADYGIAGQAYYSRPNATTGEPVPEVPSALSVRKSVAEMLTIINQQLNRPEIKAFFGDDVELYVEDAWRSTALQSTLFETAIPNLLKRNEPNLTDEQVEARRNQIIAKPALNPDSPSPHVTGGAIDVILRYKQPTLNYVEGSKVPMGHHDGDTATHIDPDYFEYHHPTTPEELEAQRNRRAFYAIMSGEAFNVDSGFVVNPTEFWHWSVGDQLAALVSGIPAYYSLALETI